MKNPRIVNVPTARRIAVRVTPVRIARNGRRCTAKNASDERRFTTSSSARRARPGGRRSCSSTRAPRPASDWFPLLLCRQRRFGCGFGLLRQPRGEKRHQLGLLLVEGFEGDLAGVVLLVHGRDALDQLVGGCRVLVEGRFLGLDVIGTV